MTLEAIYFIGQTVAAVALVVSLLFVGIQVRMSRKQSEEAERVARGQVIQHIAAENRKQANEMLAYPEIYRHFVTATDPADMTEDERSRFSAYCYSTLQMTQNIFLQQQRGLLDEQSGESYMAFLTGLIASPAGRAYWDNRRGMFHQDFAAMIDQRLADTALLGFPIEESPSSGEEQEMPD